MAKKKSTAKPKPKPKSKATDVGKAKDFTLEAPQPIRKRLKAELKPLLVHYGKAAAAFSYGSWESGVKSLIDAAATLRGVDKPEQLAWRLIYSSLVRAADKLLEEAATSRLFLKAAKSDPESIADKVLKQLEADDVILDSDFFEYRTACSC